MHGASEPSKISHLIQECKIKLREISLRNIILFWFMLLSIFPFIAVAWYAYDQNVENIVSLQHNKLSDTAALNVSTLTSRFNESVKNLESWSSLAVSTKDFQMLESDFINSQTPLNTFVHTPQYAALIKSHFSGIEKLIVKYPSVYDIFLIDLDGNILYTVKHESDLGTNLKNGSNSSSRFAQAFQKTLIDQKAHFSDIEHNKPSGGILAGFITHPLLDKSGKMIGVMALQLNMGPILGSISNSSNEIRHYLVGADGLLRTPLHHPDEVLHRRINTKVFWSWYAEHGVFGKHSDNMVEVAEFSVGPDGKKVLTEHHSVALLGVRYAHISEIDKAEVMRVPNQMGVALIALSLVIIGLVGIAAMFITRRIVKPIAQLSEVSSQYMRGIKGMRVEIQDRNEIGRFGEVFNSLMEKQEENEARLEAITAEAEKTLEELKEQKFALDAHSIVAITDVKGTMTFVNQKFEEISGFTSAELIGKNHRILNSGLHGTEFWKKMYHIVSHGGIWHEEVCNIAKDGHTYWVDTTIIAFKNEKGKPQSYIAIRTDITERKKIEAELIQAKEAAETSERAKSEFLAIMSHEIRTPMNGVLGMLGLLGRSTLDATQHHQLTVAQNSATSLLVLINDILDFSKIEAGKMELEAVEIDIHETLSELQESFLFKAREKGLELVLDDSKISFPNIITDSARLRQILTNLIGNALKFTHEGSITIKASLQTSEECGRLHIDIMDTGIGIAQDKIVTLFDPFTQADGSTTRKYGGTGLGLSIVKRLCELMGGTISIVSTLGEGSTFCMEIAVGMGSKEVPSKEETRELVSSTEKGADWSSRIRILLVEDNPTNQLVAVGMLDEIGLGADIAVNGEEAIEALLLGLKTLPYTLVLMDGQMPVMDGYDATRAIRAGEAGEENSEVIIIAMTANAMVGDREKCMNAGMDDFITKPVELSILTKTLMKWLLPQGEEKALLPLTSLDDSSPFVVTPNPDVRNDHQMLWEHEEALKRMGSNEVLLEKIIRSFITDGAVMISDLKKSVSEDDFEGAQLHAHSLKGSSLNVGAVALAGISKSIESAAKEQDSSLIQESLLECDRVWEETSSILNHHLLQTPTPAKKLRRIDPLEMAITLQALQHTLEQGVFVDTDALGIFTEYSDTTITVLMQKLKNHIEKFEYDQALETIHHVMEVLE